MTRKILWTVILPLLVLGAGVAVFRFLQATEPEVVREPDRERIWAVETVAASVGTARITVPLYGQVAAGRVVDLRPLVAGQVIEVGPGFLEGAPVAKSALLIAVDPFDFEATAAMRRADLAEAKARLGELEADLAGTRDRLERDRRQVALRRREVGRRERLLGAGNISQKALDDARLTLIQQNQALSERSNTEKRLMAGVARQRAVIDRVGISLARADRDLAETRLLAPFDGWLVDVAAQVGKRVATGDRVARLIDRGRLEVRFSVPNAVFGALRSEGGVIGRGIRVSWRLGGPPRTLAARIVRVEGEIDPTSGGMVAFAALEGIPPGMPLRAGAFVEVRLDGPELKGVVRLPEAALFEGAAVYRVGDGNRLEAVKAEIAGREGADIFVRGELAEGDRIVVTRLPEIAPGLKVAVP